MKLSTYILSILITINVYGQTKDKRADIKIRGGVKEISVSPDESIWLVSSVGDIYYTLNIDSNWYYGNYTIDSTDELGLNGPNLERISFFNKDTAIITGYISSNKKVYRKNGYYLTKDGGKTWELLDYGGNSWIYSIYTNKQGYAWMGGLSKELYFSNDYGMSWNTFKVPFNKSDRIYGIYMMDNQHGIIGSDHNEILITENNWKSSKKIPTPYDQNLFNIKTKGNAEYRFLKTQLWNNYIVVNQNGSIFYTDKDNIQWKTFPFKIVNFEVDQNTQMLYTVSDSLKIYTFSSPFDFSLLSNIKISGYPYSLKIVNESLYVLSREKEVYKINKKEFKHSYPLTTVDRIEEPYHVVQGKKICWGIDHNKLYIADDHTRDWYRENRFDFNIKEINLLNDSLAMFWDGKNNYLYSLKDHTPKLYFPETPLQSFLTSKVKTLTINAGSYGCFHNYNDEVRYVSVNDTLLKSTEAQTHEARKIMTSKFNKHISKSSIANILSEINTQPTKMPKLNDFNITNADKKEYLLMVNKILRLDEADYFNTSNKISKDFYYSVPSKLDTLSNEIINNILIQDERWSSTTTNWFSVQLINQNNDTLNVNYQYYVESQPWNLPWTFEYKNQYFKCYNLDFSKLINESIPNNFTDKEVLSNGRLIFRVAQYLWNLEH